MINDENLFIAKSIHNDATDCVKGQYYSYGL